MRDMFGLVSAKNNCCSVKKRFLQYSKLKYIAQPNNTCKETKWMEITTEHEVKCAFQNSFLSLLSRSIQNYIILKGTIKQMLRKQQFGRNFEPKSHLAASRSARVTAGES